MRRGLVFCWCILALWSCDTTKALYKYLDEFTLEHAQIGYQQPGFESYVHHADLTSQLSAILPAYHYGRAAERRQILEANNYTSLEIIRQPVITFEKRFHDFGVVHAGDKPYCIFTFKNTGNADLLIQWVASSHTTKVQWPRESIKPGASGEIVVIYDTTGKEGEEEVVVNVIANTDPEVAEARFRAFIQANGSGE